MCAARASGPDEDDDDDEDARGGGDSEWLTRLRAKETANSNLRLELAKEQRERWHEQQKASAAYHTLENTRLQEKTDLETRLEAKARECQEQKDEFSVQRAHWQALIREQNQREVELVERHMELLSDVKKLHAHAEDADAQLLATRARVEQLEGELAELRQLQQTSDDVRQGLLVEAQSRAADVDQRETELRELRLLERACQEKARAQYERHTAQVESLERQLQDRIRETDVLSERVKRVEEALRVKELEADRIRKDAMEVRSELQTKLDRCQDELHNAHTGLAARDAVESALRDRIAKLEAEIEQYKVEVQKLQQDLFKEQREREEKELAVQLASRREQQLTETIASLEEQLGDARRRGDSEHTTLSGVREQLLSVQLELQGAQRSASLFEGEVDRVRKTEEAVRKEAMWRSEEAVAQRNAEITQLQQQISERREDATRRSADLDQATIGHANEKSKLLAELKSRETELQSSEAMTVKLRSDLTVLNGQYQDKACDLAKRDKELERATQDLQNAQKQLSCSESEAASLKRAVVAAEAAEQAAEQSAAAALAKLAEQPPARPTGLVSEKEVNTSPRLMPEVATLPEGQRWGAEIAALHRSVEALHAMTAVQTRRGLEPPAEATEPGFVSRHPSKTSAIGHRSASKRPVLSSPAVSSQGEPHEESMMESGRPAGSDPGAAMEEFRDECFDYVCQRMSWIRRRMLIWDVWYSWAAVVRDADAHARLEMAVTDERLLSAQWAACRAGLDARDALVQPLPEPNGESLKRLLLEFRHRTAGATADLLRGGSADARAAFVATLVTARKSLGRILHASFFLYQKLRTLVATELREPLQDPLSQLIPVPFYVLPYKARHAMKKGAAALARGGGGRLAPGKAPKRKEPAMPHTSYQEAVAWFQEQVAELEELLPLAGSSVTEIPNFISRVLQVRSRVPLAFDGGDHGVEESPEFGLFAQMRDRIDVLLADALTVFMSAWRVDVAPHQVAAKRRPSPSGGPTAQVRQHSAPAPERSGARMGQCASNAAPERYLCLGRPFGEMLVPDSKRVTPW